uniref:Uncharacterized protein n=1 Tax=Candidatus Kentrum eta TaxID=2126337 RepID=A0A450URQ6_9GAMM|nr:MAG: hypothetical protein BECKH772A_GA0070896_1000273 [Candidatus Kentron sp. H]VFJ95150.1 MAG: hypothetical protein BECKH772C_GA0070978_10001120 [Candidatus Kentron sp. H]
MGIGRDGLGRTNPSCLVLPPDWVLPDPGLDRPNMEPELADSGPRFADSESGFAGTEFGSVGSELGVTDSGLRVRGAGWGPGPADSPGGGWASGPVGGRWGFDGLYDMPGAWNFKRRIPVFRPGNPGDGPGRQGGPLPIPREGLFEAIRGPPPGAGTPRPPPPGARGRPSRVVSPALAKCGLGE